jgi:hypothetical protein
MPSQEAVEILQVARQAALACVEDLHARPVIVHEADDPGPVLRILVDSLGDRSCARTGPHDESSTSTRGTVLLTAEEQADHHPRKHDGKGGSQGEGAHEDQRGVSLLQDWQREGPCHEPERQSLRQVLDAEPHRPDRVLA